MTANTTRARGRRVVVLACAVMAAATSAEQARPDSPAGQTAVAILGVVEDAVTGLPVRGAEVRVSGPVDRPGQLSDSRGRFVFVGLPAQQSYEVYASKHGYFDSTVGAGYPESVRTDAVRLEGGSATTLRIRLWPPAAIEGRVADERGRSIVKATVKSLRRVEVFGGSRLLPGPQAKTDDRGLFRLPGLMSGDYVLMVTAQETVAPSKEGRAQAYIHRLYPPGGGTSSADSIVLRAGATVTGLDLRLSAGPVFSIGGHVDGGVASDQGLRAVLVPADGSGDWSLNVGVTTVDSAGRFTFHGVPEGAYRVEVAAVNDTWSAVAPGFETNTGPGLGTVPGGNSVRFTLPGGASVRIPSRTAGQTRRGHAEVLVQGADIADLEVTLNAGGTLGGTIVDDRAQASPLRAMPLTLGAFPEGGLATVDPNTGRFSIEGIHGDSIWLFAPFLSIKSAIVDGKDHADRPIDMRRGPTNVVVTIADVGAQVEGRVLDERGRPVSTARVVFFPTDRDRWATTRRTGSVLTDRNGYYRLNRVTGLGLLPADEYYVAAIPDGGFEEFPRRLMESLRPAAETVVTTWGQTTVQNLRLTPAP